MQQRQNTRKIEHQKKEYQNTRKKKSGLIRNVLNRERKISYPDRVQRREERKKIGKRNVEELMVKNFLKCINLNK